MKKLFPSLLIVAVMFLNVSPAFAQLEVSPPPVNQPAPAPVPTPPPAPTPTPVPVPESTPTPVIEPAPVSTEPTTQPVTQPVQQTIAPIVAPADTTPPLISGVTEASLSETNATVIWSTDELATSHFRYGLTTSYGSTVTLGVSAALVHSATVLGLTANTTYHYCIDATDISGNTSTSCGHSFTTAATPVTLDANPPVVSLVTVAPITTSTAMIVWTTDEVANGEVEYGTTAGYGSISGYDSDFVLTDARVLSGLTPNTLYHYRIKTHDSEGNLSVTPDNTFTTNELIAVPEVTLTNPEATSTVTTNVGGAGTSVSVSSLIISSIDTSSVGSYSATISWHTDLLSDSQIEYGNSELFGLTLPVSSGLTTEHSMTISGLSPNTNYIFRVKSKPFGAVVATVSANHEFNTLPLPMFSDPAANVSSVQASPVGITTATVTWSTDKPATSQVEYGISTAYGQDSVRNSSFTSSHSIDLSGLAPDTTYHYRVKSVDNAANITYSDDQTFTTGLLAGPTVGVPTPSVTPPSPVPAAITTLTLSGVATSSASVSWVTDQSTTSQIEYGLSTSYGQEVGASTSAQLTHQVSLTTLHPNTTYHFRVKVMNEAGDVTYSDDQSFTTEALPSSSGSVSVPLPPVTIPTVPAAIITYPVIETTPSTAVVAWSTDQATTGHIEYGFTSGYGEQGSETASALSHGTTLSNLSPSTVYHYRVKVVNQTGDITYSDDLTFMTPIPSILTEPVSPLSPIVPSISATISILTISHVATSSASISWTTDQQAMGQIEYGFNTSYGQEVNMGPSTQLTHGVSLSDLIPNTTYHFRIRSITETGDVTYSDDQTFATEPLPSVAVSVGIPEEPAISIPTIPVAITTYPIVESTPSTAVVTWSTDRATTGQIEYGITSSYGEEAALTASDLSHSTTLSNLSPNTFYHFRIKVISATGDIIYSDDQTFTTGPISTPIVTEPAPSIPTVPSVPATITILTISGVTTSSASINWTTNQSTAGQVEYGLSSSYGQETGVSTSPQLTHAASLSNLAPNTTYHFRVKTINETGDITYSDDQTFIAEAVPSIPASVSVPGPTVSIPTVSASITTYPITDATPSTAVLHWSTDQTTTGEIQYGLTSSYGGHATVSTSAMSHSVTLPNLSANTLYHYRVKAITAASDITYSDDELFLTPAIPSVPSAVPSSPTSPVALTVITEVAVSGITTSAAAVSWNTDKETTGQVEYGISSVYGQQSELDSSLQTAHGLALSGLVPNTTYHYRVKTVDGSGVIVYSNDATFTTTVLSSGGSSGNISVENPAIPEAVAAPASVITLAVSDHDQSSATLGWNVTSPEADAAMEYDVRYSKQPITDANFASATQAQSTPIFYADIQPSGDHRTYLVAGLDPNTTYYFALKSKFEHSDWSSASNAPSVKTGNQAIVAAPSSTNGSSASVGNTGGGSSSNTQTGSSSGGSGGGGGGFSGNFSSFAEAPILINASGDNGQIVLTWKNPNENAFVRTVLVKKEGSAPTSAKDGQVLYEGRGETFADTQLTNGTTYYYALYTYNHAKVYSAPVHIALAASVNSSEVVFNENPAIEPATTNDHFVETFKLGSKDIEIEHLQQILAADGKLYPEKLVTGYFGTLTQSALKKFQAKHHLPQTGITDVATRAKLNVVSQSLVNTEIPGDLAVFSTNLQYGQSGDEVANLQQLLLIEGAYEKLIVTGTFDMDTRNAVIAFQKKYHVQPASGYVGYKTRHVIETISGL